MVLIEIRAIDGVCIICVKFVMKMWPEDQDQDEDEDGCDVVILDSCSADQSMAAVTGM